MPAVRNWREKYHVSVYTSWESPSRFTGAVSLQLYGEAGHSIPCPLVDGERKVRDRRRVYTFVHVGVCVGVFPTAF